MIFIPHKENEKGNTKKNWFLRFFIIILVLITVFFAVSFTIFKIREVKVIGNSVISSDVILNQTELTNNKSLILINSFLVKRNLGNQPYLKTVELEKVWPDKLVLSVTERIPRAYVEYSDVNCFLLVDEDGVVLEVLTERIDNKPVIVGLDYKQFVIGERLEVKNKEAFEDVVILAGFISTSDIQEEVKVDISKKDDIHLFVRDIDVAFGDTNDIEKKVLILREILNYEKESLPGFLDLSDVEATKKAYFKHMK